MNTYFCKLVYKDTVKQSFYREADNREELLKALRIPKGEIIMNVEESWLSQLKQTCNDIKDDTVTLLSTLDISTETLTKEDRLKLEIVEIINNLKR